MAAPAPRRPALRHPLQCRRPPPRRPPPEPDLGSGPSWFSADPPAILGAQGRIFSRACAQFILEKMRGPGLRQDQQMALLAAILGPLWVHRPSLVQHTGRHSTWAGPWHQAFDFDPEWKAD